MLFNLLLVLGFAISSFIFFKLVKDDIKLISLRIREETIFDIFFLTSLAALLFARVLFVATHFSDFGIAPLKILLITYFPGLSFVGGVLGAVAFLFWFLKRNNILKLRIFDLAILSFLPVIILGFLGDKQFLEAIVFITLAIFLIRLYRNPQIWRLNFQGVFFLSFLLVSSVTSFIFDFAKEDRVLLKLLTVEQILSMVIFIVAGYFSIRGLKRGYI